MSSLLQPHESCGAIITPNELLRHIDKETSDCLARLRDHRVTYFHVHNNYYRLLFIQPKAVVLSLSDGER